MLQTRELERCDIDQGNIAKKGERISKAITIIWVLEGSLDFKNGGEISTNLSALYTYSSEQLLAANANNDSSILDEVIQILLPIKAGWDSIPRENQADVSF